MFPGRSVMSESSTLSRTNSPISETNLAQFSNLGPLSPPISICRLALVLTIEKETSSATRDRFIRGVPKTHTGDMLLSAGQYCDNRGREGAPRLEQIGTATAEDSLSSFIVMIVCATKGLYTSQLDQAPTKHPNPRHMQLNSLKGILDSKQPIL